MVPPWPTASSERLRSSKYTAAENCGGPASSIAVRCQVLAPVRRAQHVAVVPGQHDGAVRRHPGGVGPEGRGFRPACRSQLSPSSFDIRNRPSALVASNRLPKRRKPVTGVTGSGMAILVTSQLVPPSAEMPRARHRRRSARRWRPGSTNEVCRSWCSGEGSAVQRLPPSVDRRMRPRTPAAIQRAARRMTGDGPEVGVVAVVPPESSCAPASSERRTAPLRAQRQSARCHRDSKPRAQDRPHPAWQRATNSCRPRSAGSWRRCPRPAGSCRRGSSRPPLRSGLITCASYAGAAGSQRRRQAERNQCGERAKHAPGRKFFHGRCEEYRRASQDVNVRRLAVA